MATRRRVVICGGLISLGVMVACGPSGAGPGDSGTDSGHGDGDVDNAEDGSADGSPRDGGRPDRLDGAPDDGGSVNGDGGVPVEGVSCRSLELAVNTDAPSDGALRFAGFALGPSGAGIRDARFERVEVTAGPLTGLEASGHLGTSRQGHVILGTTAPADRTSACESGPAWSRLSGGDVELTVSGRSGGEPFTQPCTVDARDVLVTCHTGASRIAEALVDAFEVDGTLTADVGTTVYPRTSLSGEEEVRLDAQALHSDATTVLEMATGDSHRAMAYDDEPPRLQLNWQGDGLDESACPGPVSEPPPLVVTYEGSVDGAPFSGAGPAEPCVEPSSP